MDRFIMQGNVVLDVRTGLMWTTNASLFEFPLTWNEALSFVHGLNRERRFGFDDWKLPNRSELFSLICHETINPCLPSGHPFEEVFTGYYWTSTTCARLPDQAWYVHLGGARVFKGMKKNAYMVWPMRIAEKQVGHRVLQTGQAHCFDEHGKTISCKQTGQDGEFGSGRKFGIHRFAVQDHLVHDRATDLMWIKNANPFTTMQDWSSALDAVKQMNKANPYGFDDWRLPSIVELESLIDMDRHTPALPLGHPFMNLQNFYWSTTTSMYNTQYAWTLYTQDGAIGVGYKRLPEFYCWPVRGLSPIGDRSYSPPIPVRR